MADVNLEIFVKHGNDELVRSLQSFCVNFIVVGGVAVAVHGCRDSLHVDDFDILVEPTIENSKNIISALKLLHINVPFSAEDLARPLIQVPLKCMHYWADILTPSCGVDFAQLVDRSVQARVGESFVLVIGRRDLVEMKKNAIATVVSDSSKHELDLMCLESME